MWLLHTPLILVGLLALSWFVYIAVFSAKPNSADIKKKSPFLYWFMWGVAAAGWVLDVILNATVFSVLFMDYPRELTITHRLRRYLRDRTGWRRKAADWICKNMLEPIDCTHCGRK